MDYIMSSVGNKLILSIATSYGSNGEPTSNLSADNHHRQKPSTVTHLGKRNHKECPPTIYGVTAPSFSLEALVQPQRGKALSLAQGVPLWDTIILEIPPKDDLIAI